MAYDVITVGSGTIDVFIDANKKELKPDKGHNDVCFEVGEKILIDDVHFDTGGGGTNTAVAFSRLGMKTAWLGKLGDDLNSENVLRAMTKEKVNFIGPRSKGKTGYSVILVHLPRDRTILTHKGINDELSINEVNLHYLNTKWLYFSSMLGKSFETAKRIALYAGRNRIRWAFNPSMYLAEKGLKALMPLLKGCDVLILNKEEAQALTGKKAEMKSLLKILKQYVKIIVITDGKNGAYVFDGHAFYHNMPHNIKVVETTGAGDAFASGFVSGIMMHQNIEFALQLGQAESESVIQHYGAKNKLLTRFEAFKLARKVKVTKGDA